MGEGGSDTWLDEVDFNPEGAWLSMGTRALGARPWLVVDEAREAELALKAELTATRRDEVFAAEPNTEGPARVVASLVAAELGEYGIGIDGAATAEVRHPLEATGLGVQEDLCLLRREADGWLLVAASLCFPSRWRLAEKMGRPLLEVHGPVKGYGEVLAARVDGLLDRLGDRIVWRRNWFIHPDAALYQPDRPVGAEPALASDQCLAGLHLRSERQTLRTVDATHVLFTIRIQQVSVAQLVAEPEHKHRLVDFVTSASLDLIEHRGVSDAQRRELVSALIQHRPLGSGQT